MAESFFKLFRSKFVFQAQMLKKSLPIQIRASHRIWRFSTQHLRPQESNSNPLILLCCLSFPFHFYFPNHRTRTFFLPKNPLPLPPPFSKSISASLSIPSFFPFMISLYLSILVSPFSSCQFLRSSSFTYPSHNHLLHVFSLFSLSPFR